jgi:hypothetical protein
MPACVGVCVSPPPKKKNFHSIALYGEDKTDYGTHTEFCSKFRISFTLIRSTTQLPRFTVRMELT